MTRDETLNRLAQLNDESEGRINPSNLRDARTLISLLPDTALSALPENWLRRQCEHRDRIDFFWSRTKSFMTPGNRILTITTLGFGEFQVEVGDPTSIQWQRSPEGKPLTDRLSLGADGAKSLVESLSEWQLS